MFKLMLRRATHLGALFVTEITMELCIILKSFFAQFARVLFNVAVLYPVGLQVSDISFIIITIGAFM